MTDFYKFKEELSSKKKFYNSLASKINCGKKYEHVLKVWNKFGMKTMKYYRDL